MSCSCRLWWLFAIQANLSEIREQRQRGSWEFALHRARDAQTYTSLYFRRLKGIPLSPEEEVLFLNFMIPLYLEQFISIILMFSLVLLQQSVASLTASVQCCHDAFHQSRLF